MNSVNAKRFWNEKISHWEKHRYERRPQSGSCIEWIAGRASTSLRYRITLAGQILEPACAGKRVVELGCASGRIAGGLVRAGAAEYTGYDISSEAISAANHRIETEGLPDTVSFHVSDILSLPRLDADIVFSLGLLDWLADEQISALFAACPDAHFLHSFSEKRVSVSQLLHRIYVHVAYGYRTQGYVPRYQSADAMTALATPHCNHSVSVYRDANLAFGALLMTLPNPRGSR